MYYHSWQGTGYNQCKLTVDGAWIGGTITTTNTADKYRTGLFRSASGIDHYCWYKQQVAHGGSTNYLGCFWLYDGSLVRRLTTTQETSSCGGSLLVSYTD